MRMIDRWGSWDFVGMMVCGALVVLEHSWTGHLIVAPKEEMNVNDGMLLPFC